MPIIKFTKPFSIDTMHLYIYERLLWASAIDTYKKEYNNVV